MLNITYTHWVNVANNEFYPTIATLFDSNRPAVYNIAIYGRLYTAE